MGQEKATDSGHAGHPNFRILSDAQCRALHDASLQILERSGVRVRHPEALSLLREAGASVLDDRVRFPPDLVTWALKSAPANIVLHARDGLPALQLEGRNVYFGTGSDCPNILDSFTGERRRFLKADVAQGIRLCDALPNIDFVLSIGLISDVPAAISDVHQFEAMLANTTKPIVFTAHGRQGCIDIVQMAEIVAGGAEELRARPHIAAFVEANPPLQFNPDTMDKVLLMAEKGLPVVFSSGPMMGVSGPQTHAGILALANAENLAGNTIMQLKHEGAPFVYAHGISPLDMRTMVVSYGAPELALNSAALADLAHYYNLPVWGFGGCSDAKVLDQQAALEGSMHILMSVLAGNNLVHDVGYLESGLTSSFEMIAFSDMAIELARRALAPIVIDDETLALDLIDEVGPGGSFLATDHTYRHFRDVWYSDLVDRRAYPAWVEGGRQTLAERLNAKVKRLLAEHVPDPLPDDTTRQMEAILRRAEQRVC